MLVKVAFVLLALTVVVAQAKPSHNFGFHGVPNHLDLVPPVLPPAHFHGAAAVAPVYPYHHHANLLPAVPIHSDPFLPAPGPVLPAPAPLLPAPQPLVPAPSHLLHDPAASLPAFAPLLLAPTPLLPAPVVYTHAHVVPSPDPILPPVFEAIPFAEPLPTYRAIAGPKTTTHHVSLGYAYPQTRLTKLHAHVHAVPHAHVHAAPLTFARHHPQQFSSEFSLFQPKGFH